MGKRTPKCTKAVGYVRVSTGKQDCSLEAQEERIRLYCQLNGLELVEVIRESVSDRVKTEFSGLQAGAHQVRLGCQCSAFVEMV